MQLEIQDGSLAQIPQSTINKGLQLVLDWSMQYLEDPKCPVRVAVDWSSTTLISAVIRSIVASKATTGINEESMDTVIIPLIIQAFVSVFGYVVEHPNENIPVQLLFTPSFESIAKSEVWKQTIFLDFLWPTFGRSQHTKQNVLSPPICNARVALFNITIEPLADSEEKDSFDGTSIMHIGSSDAFRLKALQKVGDQLERLGATAVLSQKIIPTYLQTYLATKGIFSLGRLSAARIHGVELLSGATILSDWRIDDSVVSRSLGFLSLITTHTLGRKQFIRLHREDRSSQSVDSENAHPVTTIAIAAPDRFAYDELSHVITVSLKMLANLIDKSEVVAGAGCFEIHLAAVLRHRASQLITILEPNAAAFTSIQMNKQTKRTLRQLSQTITAFATCLEDMVGHLCGSHALLIDRAATIHQVCDANRESLAATKALLCDVALTKHDKLELFGWSPTSRSTIKVLSYEVQNENHNHGQERVLVDARIVDNLQSKKDALVLAIESVSSLARIASVVQAT